MNESTENEDSLTPALRSNWSIDYIEELDTSIYPFPNKLWNIKPAQELIIKSTAMVIIGVVGIYLNSVILFIIARNKWLWTASNYLVWNMAVVDFLTLLFCPWFMLIRDFYQNYVLGNFGCRFEGFLQATLLLAGVGAVILVSYDRLAAAAFSQDARITKSAAPKLIMCAWVSAIALSLPWITKRKFIERQWLDYLELFCMENESFLNAYWHVILTVLVWIPLGVMLLTYGTIMWRLEYSVRKLGARGTAKCVSRARDKAMKITACVLASAIVCRVPYTVLLYWRNNLSMEINSVDGAFSVMWFTANYLIYLNAALNPLIYGFTNERFRRAMDRTPGVACCKFGTWCCICALKQKKEVQTEDKNTEKIFVIENSPRPNQKIGHLIKNMLHIHKDTFECSVPKVEEASKPTRITPLKYDDLIAVN